MILNEVTHKAIDHIWNIEVIRREIFINDKFINFIYKEKNVQYEIHTNRALYKYYILCVGVNDKDKYYGIENIPNNNLIELDTMIVNQNNIVEMRPSQNSEYYVCVFQSGKSIHVKESEYIKLKNQLNGGRCSEL